jgi:hypothetical protein
MDPESELYEFSVGISFYRGEEPKTVTHSQKIRAFTADEIKSILQDAGFHGVQEKDVYGNQLYYGTVAQKGTARYSPSGSGFTDS